MRHWPLERGRIVTSPFGPRAGGFHYGVDFGFSGGSGGKKVFAISPGRVKYVGAAQGYGGPDPHGWIVIESQDGTWEYGHITRLPNVTVGQQITGGQQIAVINPDSRTNAGTAPHLHLSWMPGRYQPDTKADPMPVLAGSREPGGEGTIVDRPDYNEYGVWSPNVSSRNGIRPDLWLIHTQEGGSVKDGADSLARWMSKRSANVSYHYTISEDPVDHGVTVCDVVDTDMASWSVLDYNARSISLCFAGSRVAWSTEEWMKQSRAIDVAAFLAVQDAIKYRFEPKVIAPPYNSKPPGISDHAYVTHMGIGSHTDVGKNFPWRYFSERVAHWAAKAGAVSAAPPVNKPSTPKPKPVVPVGDPMAARWNCLGGQTVVEALAEVRDKVLGTNDRGKAGVKDVV